MPGMMDTILNLGLNDEVAAVMTKETGNERFAYDSYRRFILMYFNVVRGEPRHHLEAITWKQRKLRLALNLTLNFGPVYLKELVVEYKEHYKKVLGEDFPVDPRVQLLEAVTAVFRSWDNERANVYRKMNHIPYEWGTAVNVQSMVFGNKGETSGTGVAFSRNPATGEKHIFAEYLPDAQGEDVVAGIRTPLPITWLAEKNACQFINNLKIPIQCHGKTLTMICKIWNLPLKKVNFTSYKQETAKELLLLPLKLPCDFIDEGLISEEEAVLRVDPSLLDSLLHPGFDQKTLAKTKAIAKRPSSLPWRCHW